jgi:hypothetical protein
MEFSLIIGALGIGCLVFENIEVWFVDSGYSLDMTRMS